jgi:mannose-6-phosphate isomerase-like protein (cupin superfamily)
MDTLERATVYTVIDVLDYPAGKLETVRIMSKTTGSVTLVAVDAGVNTENAVSPFDTLLYLLDGSAEITIDRKSHHLSQGQCIILPAHLGSHVSSTTKFKMLLVTIKSGYES